METFDEVFNAILTFDDMVLDHKIFESNLEGDIKLKSFAKYIDKQTFSENPFSYKDDPNVMAYIHTLGEYLKSHQALVLSEKESPFILLKLELRGLNHHKVGFYLRGFEGKYNSSTKLVNEFTQRIEEVTQKIFDLENFSKYKRISFSPNGEEEEFYVKNIFADSFENAGITITVLGEGTYRFANSHLVIDPSKVFQKGNYSPLAWSQEAVEKLGEKLNHLSRKNSFRKFSLENVLVYR